MESNKLLERLSRNKSKLTDNNSFGVTLDLVKHTVGLGMNWRPHTIDAVQTCNDVLIIEEPKQLIRTKRLVIGQNCKDRNLVPSNPYTALLRQVHEQCKAEPNSVSCEMLNRITKSKGICSCT